MKQKLIIILTIVIAITSFSFNIMADILPEKSKILLIGDSLAVGLTNEFKHLAIKNGYIAYSHAINGTQTSYWKTVINSDLIKYKPDMVMVVLGTNDSVLSDSWVMSHEDDYATLVNKIKKTGSQVVWIGPPTMTSSRIQSQFQVMKLIRLAADNYYESTSLDFERSIDGIHSTPTGYKAWMDSIWFWMAEKQLIQLKLSK